MGLKRWNLVFIKFKIKESFFVFSCLYPGKFKIILKNFFIIRKREEKGKKKIIKKKKKRRR